MKKRRPLTPQELDAVIIDTSTRWVQTTQWAVLAVRSRAFRAFSGDRAIYRYANLHTKYGSPG